jgi:outer membrane immunogenic protein
VDSWLGGVQVGCDYQFAGGWVIGIQGDWAWTDAEGSNPDTFDPTFINRSKIKSLGSVTGRIGYAFDRFLGYVRGGWAWERDDYEIFDTIFLTSATASETRGGWTVGIGGEYAFTNWLSIFAEYNYYDFGTRQNTFTGFLNGAPGTFYVDVEETKSVVKVGLNLRWGGSAIAARY